MSQIAVGLAISFLLFLNSPNSGYGDDGVYIAAGERFIHNLNLYDPAFGFRGGVVSAAILYFASLLVGQFFWVLLQLFNLMGIYIFCNKYLHPQTKVTLNWIFVFIIFTAPTREMLHNHQLTGLIILFAVIAFSYNSRNFYHQGFQVALICMAIDLKPHLAFPLFLVLAIYSGKLKLLFLSIPSLVLLHLLADVYSRKFIQLEWFHSLNDVSNGGANGLGESLNLVGYLNIFEVEKKYIQAISLFISIVVLWLSTRLARVKLLHEALFCLVISQYFMPYNHLYDFVILMCLLVWQNAQQNQVFTLLAIMFALLPQEVLSLKNVLLLCIFLCIRILRDPHQICAFKKILLCFVIIVPLHLLNYFYLFHGKFNMVNRTTEIVVLSVCALIVSWDSGNLRKVVFN